MVRFQRRGRAAAPIPRLFAAADAAGYRAAMTDEDLLSAWPERPALFLDLDGTLLEFADVPDGATPSTRLRELLRRFAALEDYAVAFVSGRTIDALDGLLSPHRFPLAGVHGNERRGFHGGTDRPIAAGVILNSVRARLREFEAQNPGVMLEEKQIGMALHFRRRPDLADAVHNLGLELAQSLPPALELLHGKMLIEIKPAGLDKGKAINAFMQEEPFAGRTPVFIGDDVTDEPGFRTVNALGGLSIKVNNGPTAAHWRLPSVDAVLAYLEKVVPG
jgi:trehalose 6-phosphate phosphatase